MPQMSEVKNDLICNWARSMPENEGWSPWGIVHVPNILDCAMYLTSTEDADANRRPYEEWCDSNCVGHWQIDQYFPVVYFEFETDAAHFKLVHECA